MKLSLTTLCLIGSGCLLGEVLAKLNARPDIANALGTIGLPTMWSYVVGSVVYRASGAQANRAIRAVSKDWLPEVVDIKLSPDLLPEFTDAQEEIVKACRAFRLEQGITSPIIRIRDDPQTASRSYTISINGIRIFGATLNPSEDFKTQALAALKTVWTNHGEAIRFFADLRGHAA